jgi:hypothetical protein
MASAASARSPARESIDCTGLPGMKRGIIQLTVTARKKVSR